MKLISGIVSTNIGISQTPDQSDVLSDGSDDPFAGDMDPDRDPRFIATGRAAIAAMTCGQIDLLTSTPLGRRTHQSVNQCDALAGSYIFPGILFPHSLRHFVPRHVG